jgi:peptidoglycan-associated lipoprotein
MRRTAILISIAGAALAAACHSAPPPDPAPQPTPEVALTQNEDSIAAAARATADSIERVRQAEFAARARADSLERVRIAEAKIAELQTELAVMVHFDVARAQLQPDGRDALDRKVAILNANPEVRLRITGACDERGSDAYNMALGKRRAASVKQYLIEKGIDATRLEPVSTGETSPLDSGSDETAWVQNRRAEFVVVSGDLTMN